MVHSLKGTGTANDVTEPFIVCGSILKSESKRVQVMVVELQ